MSAVVYAATNKTNGKMYVGKSHHVDRRWWEHLNDARNGDDRPLYRALRKYGVEAFDFQVIEHCADDRDALNAERYWIGWYGTIAPGGYNLTTGGEAGGTELSAESREKIARKLRGRKRPKDVVARVAAANTGRIQSDEERAMRSKALKGKAKGRPGHVPSQETREKLRAAMTGRVFTEEWRAKISVALAGKKRRPLSDDQRAAISQRNKGRVVSKETRQRISDAKKAAFAARRGASE